MLVSQRAFSLIEILVWILIVSAIMTAAFQTLSAVWIAKVKLVEQTEIEKQAYFSSERFFELIKKWGTLDYEEYWNRYSYGTWFLNGHFALVSWFWNYWFNWTIWWTLFWWRPYNCISNWWNMWENGCLTDKNISYNWSNTNLNKFNNPQRYGQYALQFIDRNSDNDADWGLFWDEDGDGNIIWDDDDLFLGIGPRAFIGSTENKIWELYLISNDGRERTYFRWRVEDVSWEDFAPSSANCNWLNTEAPTWIWCQWTIEMLKLVWADYGYNHTLWWAWNPDADGSQWDWVLDTWLIHPDYASWDATIIAGSNTENYWQPIFPTSINIKDFEMYAYPNKDLNLSWRDDNESILIAPYIQINYTIEPSLKVQAKISWSSPSVNIATTISLSNLDIK